MVRSGQWVTSQMALKFAGHHLDFEPTIGPGQSYWSKLAPDRARRVWAPELPARSATASAEATQDDPEGCTTWCDFANSGGAADAGGLDRARRGMRTGS